jgi:hypothetical protein
MHFQINFSLGTSLAKILRNWGVDFTYWLPDHLKPGDPNTGTTWTELCWLR